MLTGIVLLGGMIVSEAMSAEAAASGIRQHIPDQNSTGAIIRHTSSHTVAQEGKPYEAGARRDPFVPLNRGRMKRAAHVDRPNGLEKGSDVPKVLGIVSGQKGYRAILQGVNGQRILVGTGSVLEHERARVIHISDNTVSLEYRLDENGKDRLLERRISIHQTE